MVSMSTKTWIALKCLMQNERSEFQKFMIPFIRHSQKRKKCSNGEEIHVC